MMPSFKSIRAIGCVVACAIALAAQTAPPMHGPPDDGMRLPNGKSQKEAIIKEDYAKNLDESRELVRLTEALRDEIEKADRNIISMTAIRKTEEIEKLAKRIRSRMKRF